MLSRAQVKNIKQLHQKKFRSEQGLFIAEGPKVVEELLASEIPVRDIYALHNWLDKKLLNGKSCKITEISQEELDSISALQAPKEVLAVCETPAYPVTAIDKRAELFLYLDGISDPGNLGTIIRMSEWFGLSQVFLAKNSAEVFNPKVVQSSMGSLARVKPFYMELPELKNITNAKETWGAELSGENVFEISASNSCILVIGSESHGISPGAQKTLSKRISIPAAAGAMTESLNAATAASIILSELFRKKHFSK
jgi:TrmH family RNA methyltransferase